MIMVKRVHSDLFGSDGEDKFHYKEFSDSDGNLMDDFVVESGNNYTKWNSGKIEIWFEETDITNVGTGQDRLTYTHPILNELVSSGPQTLVFFTLRTSTMGVFSLKIPRAWYDGVRNILVDVEKSSTTTGSITIRFYIIGRWK